MSFPPALMHIKTHLHRMVPTMATVTKTTIPPDVKQTITTTFVEVSSRISVMYKIYSCWLNDNSYQNNDTPTRR